jgi:hypothetical protein
VAMLEHLIEHSRRHDGVWFSPHLQVAQA